MHRAERGGAGRDTKIQSGADEVGKDLSGQWQGVGEIATDGNHSILCTEKET